MALVSNTVQDSGNVLSLSPEATHIISTSVIVEDISETTFVAVLDTSAIFTSVTLTVITDSEVSPPTTPVEVIFVSSDNNDKTLSLSCTAEQISLVMFYRCH
jgi:hypothetical protein